MAGIGFELRKAIQQDSVRGKFSGYLGAAFSSSGSMLVGIILFFFVQLGAKIENVSQVIIDQFMCYVTNTMFYSMVVVSIFSLILSRYVSNRIFEEQHEKVMPSLIGATAVVSVGGSAVFALLMAMSGMSLSEGAVLLLLYLVLSSCWLLMSYVTLIRNYKWVVISYLTAFVIAMISLVAICIFTQLDLVMMILVLVLCFAVVDILLFRTIYRSFPNQDNSMFSFLSEYRSSPALSVMGLFMMLGMLGHFWATWFTAADSVSTFGLFRYGPTYDFPAIVAFFSTIPTSIYFITIFETDFSERYQRYFYLLGHGGSVESVNSAKEEMIDSIRNGIRKLTQIQIVTCILFITVGGKLLAILNIGMTETMLDTYRMFCVGYSLYFIANTLLLIHLYFMNEKRMLLASGLFALVATLSAWYSAKYLPGTAGLGFTVICGLMVLISAVKLVRYMSKLEYFVFSKQTYTMNKNTKKHKDGKNSKRNVFYAVVAGCVCFVVMVFSMGTIVKDVVKASKIFTFTPTKSDAVLLNSPGMGLAPWADSEETKDIASTLVYVELKWSDWEPEEGVYDVDFVNEHFNLDYYRKENRQVVFRFICDDPGESEHIDIPEWLFQMIEADGTMYSIDYGKGFSPNYSNKIFIEKHAEAISALGEFFGNDDFFIYVELGSLGHWGEWHVNYEKGIGRLPEYAVRQDYIHPYLDAFPNASFLLRYPLIDAVNNGFGLYNDMTGDYDETAYWIEQMNGGVWEQTELEEQAVCVDVWKTNPIGGEFASTQEDYSFMVTDFDLTLESIIDSHQSFIGPKVIIDESETDYSVPMNKILKTIGYRYYVENVTVDMNKRDTITVTCSMGNDGIAPIYSSYEVKLALVDDEGTDVWVSEGTEFDLRTLLSDQKKSFSCDIDKNDLESDRNYKLVISVCNESGEAVVPLALENEVERNCYQIAEFKIK